MFACQYCGGVVELVAAGALTSLPFLAAGVAHRVCKCFKRGELEHTQKSCDSDKKDQKPSGQPSQ